MVLGKISPYSPGAGVLPPALCGREREVEHANRLFAYLSAGHHKRGMLISGVRGVGKTVLLTQFEETVPLCAGYLGRTYGTK